MGLSYNDLFWNITSLKHLKLKGPIFLNIQGEKFCYLDGSNCLTKFINYITFGATKPTFDLCRRKNPFFLIKVKRMKFKILFFHPNNALLQEHEITIKSF